MFDLTIIGAGPAGYVCAIRAAQLGMKVCLVEKRKELGGTCLNVGCIPSKALLESSHYYVLASGHLAGHDLANHGVKVKGVELDVPALIARKDGVVKQLTGGIAMLMKKNGITVKQGWGKVLAQGKVDVDGEVIETQNIVLAAGSVPIALPFAPFDGEVIIDSTEALSLSKVPTHMVVIGAGVIGLELGSVWARLGARVTVLDVAERPVAIMDEDLGKEAQKLFAKQGLAFELGAKVSGIVRTKGGAEVAFTDATGATRTLVGDKVLVAVGRKAATAGMGLAEAGIKMNERGVIETDAHYQTSVPHIYAIGDCITGPMLAHKGEEEGVALAEMLAGQKGHVNYAAIPWVVYTHPELAGVGLTEAQARAQYGAVKVGKFKFAANGRALAVDQADGFVKVVAHAETDELLGVHMIGHNVSELIGEAACLMEFKASAEDLARCVHAHPTLSEAVKEAALAAQGRALHS